MDNAISNMKIASIITSLKMYIRLKKCDGKRSIIFYSLYKHGQSIYAKYMNI